jgi:hypothetical protein
MTPQTWVRLTRKYAEAINGIKLSGYVVGDRLRLPERDAALLIAEGWAVACADPLDEVPATSIDDPLQEAADAPKTHEPEGT